VEILGWDADHFCEGSICPLDPDNCSFSTVVRTIVLAFWAKVFAFVRKTAVVDLDDNTALQPTWRDFTSYFLDDAAKFMAEDEWQGDLVMSFEDREICPTYSGEMDSYTDLMRTKGLEGSLLHFECTRRDQCHRRKLFLHEDLPHCVWKTRCFFG
tara:strand:- start:9898 stop:10362 length:465 start_codon:yes stop_codon:yes gene_type:complete